MKIKSIKKIEYSGDVYNLHIKDNHNYFANNHCVSNCHDFDTVFSDFISININEFALKKLKFNSVDKIIKSVNKISSIEQALDFFENFLLDEIGKTKAKLKSELSSKVLNKRQVNRDLKIDDITGGSSDSVKTIRLLNDLDTYESKIENFIKDFQKMPENWVLEWSMTENKNKSISVQPVWSHPYLDKYVWSKYDHVILMSGTILDKEMFSYLNGIKSTQSAYYSIPSPFIIKNRPIYYMPIGRMTYKNKTSAFKSYLPIINKILKKYSKQKGIMHSVTYELANWVKDSVNDDRLIFHESDSKDRALRKHYESDEPTVLVSPSMNTGVNLEYDRARFQVLLKVPYPSLASQKYKMRQKMMPKWYTWRTISGIIQAYGRAIRSYNDKADFIILDSCFSDILKYHSDMIPEYITKAIKRVDVR